MEPLRLAGLLGFRRLPGYLADLGKELDGLKPPPELSRPVKSLTAGGKRLRPVIVFAGAAAGGGKITPKVRRAAATIELVHLASLAHDDVIDRSPARRGQAAVTAQSIGTAILTGDWLLAQAGAVAAGVSREAAAIIADTVSQMSAGQAAQIKLKPPFDCQSPHYHQIINQKTASLMSAAGRLGAISAGMNTRLTEALAAHGQCFGMAYQIIDDILDGDITAGDHDKAKELAQAYCDQAAEALSNLPDSPVKTSLAGLPSGYLNWALNR